MISKCQNVLVNKTKFSDFEEFDVTTQSTEGLKLVGFLETTDLCTGDTIKKNVSVEYPSVSTPVALPSNYAILNLSNNTIDTSKISVDIVNDGFGQFNCYRINSGFDGSFIQINFKQEDWKIYNNKFFFENSTGHKCFNISFDRYIPLGKEIKVLFYNFPIHETDNFSVRLLDYEKTNVVGAASTVLSSDILFSHENGFNGGGPKNFLVTFVQRLATTATSDSHEQRTMVATNIELIH